MLCLYPYVLSSVFGNNVRLSVLYGSVLFEFCGIVCMYVCAM